MHVIIQVVLRLGALIIGLVALTTIGEIIVKRDIKKAKETEAKDIREAFKEKGWKVAK
jgi:hypothetical protein